LIRYDKIEIFKNLLKKFVDEVKEGRYKEDLKDQMKKKKYYSFQEIIVESFCYAL
jgi:hypothetical protein